jgi:signal transduction histidine kinase
MSRFQPSLTELGIAAASAALTYLYVRSDSPGAAPVAAGVVLAVGVLGVVTAGDRPDRSGLVRATIACAAGVLIGNLGPGGFVRASLLIVVFAVGRTARMLPLERRATAERAATAVAEERARIARDLHDVIAHSLSVVVVQVQAADRVMDDDPAKAHEALQAAAAVGRDALDDMHRMVGMMRGTDTRQAQPSLADLPRLVEQSRQAGANVELHVHGAVSGTELPPGLEVAAFRIIQEALTNAARYAAGAAVDVRVEVRPDGLEIEVANGAGRGRSAGSGGFGIAGMRERAALYQGTVEAGPRSSGGYAVKVWLPKGRG